MQKRHPTVWRAWALWPGLQPLLMGWVWGSSQANALCQAGHIWPEVPDWNIEGIGG